MDRTKYFYTDKMYFSPEVFKPEVRLDEDGFYRWMYKLDPYHDREMYKLLLKIWAFISLCGIVMGYLLADMEWPVPIAVIRESGYSHYQMMKFVHGILFGLLGYAVFFAAGLLITGLVRLIDGGPAKYWYQTNEHIIQIKPSGKGSGVSFFEDLTRIEVFREVNEIRLFQRWGKTPVLVRHEDFDLILQHILAHVPESAVVEEKI